MRINKKLITQIVFFGLVGVGSLLIDLGVTLLLFHAVGLSAFLSSAIGFLSAFFFNFPMNRKKVFNHSSDDRFSLRIQAIMYTVLCVFNLVATSLLVELLVTYEVIEIQYAKLLTTAIIAVWNFVIFKFVVFSKISEKAKR